MEDLLNAVVHISRLIEHRKFKIWVQLLCLPVVQFLISEKNTYCLLPIYTGVRVYGKDQLIAVKHTGSQPIFLVLLTCKV